MNAPDSPGYLPRSGVLQDVSAALGRQVSSLSELYSGRLGDYRDALPVLIAWVSREEDPRRLDGIARCLAVLWAKGIAGPSLIAKLKEDAGAEQRVLWALANAVEVVATGAELEDICTLVFDERYGGARKMLTLALGKINDPGAVAALRELLKDPLVDGHAVQALGRLASLPEAQLARPAVLTFLNDPMAWKRRAAKSTIARLDRYSRNARSP